VEDADESVAQGAQGLVVQVAGGAVVVVEGAGAGTDTDRAEGLLVNGVVEASVATCRASTTRFLPEATVSGDVPA
jgi:hypothetical protein